MSRPATCAVVRRPRLLVHGHYHVADEAVVHVDGAEHDTRVWSLAANKGDGNIRYLDLSDVLDGRR